MLSIGQSLLNFVNLTVEKLVLIYENQKYLTIQLNDRIAGLDKSELTYWDCFEYGMQEEAKYTLEFALIDFENIHPNQEIRDKSTELNKELMAFGIEQSMRQDVYDVILHYYSNQYVHEQQMLTSEQRKYVENTMIGYNMLGLGLDSDKKKKVKEIA
jgi:hypothetical protein